MPPPTLDDVSALLVAWGRGDAAAREKLIPLVYEQLRRVAARHVRGERRCHTFQATAVVHEVYLRLVQQKRARWQNRAQFFAVASRLIRRILVDHAREHSTVKRGGGMWKVELAEDVAAGGSRDLELIGLDDALEELRRLDERQLQVVEMRFFGGLSIEQTADVLGLSTATVNREWGMARVWLKRRLREGAQPR